MFARLSLSDVRMRHRPCYAATASQRRTIELLRRLHDGWTDYQFCCHWKHCNRLLEIPDVATADQFGLYCNYTQHWSHWASDRIRFFGRLCYGSGCRAQLPEAWL